MLPTPRLDQMPGGTEDHLTRDVQNDFLQVQTLDDLRTCYLRNLENLGNL